MISIREYSSNTKLPGADYVFDDIKKLSAVLLNLTPKIVGFWEMLLVNPTIKECKQVLDNFDIPQWITLTIFLQEKKLEVIGVDYPQYHPKKVTFREQAQTVLGSIKHTIDTKAFNILVDAFRGNIVDFQETLGTLDKEVKSDVITVRDVQKHIVYQRPTYASEVLNAFLLRDKNCWKLLDKLVTQLGQEYAYNSLYKYSKTLLKEKNDYLHNVDVKNFVVKRIDAPAICYAYVTFCMSSNYKQLYCILQSIVCRGTSSLDNLSEVYLD